MMITIDKEKLEIKEFILDSNLYLISNSLMMVMCLGGFFYYCICLFYYAGKIDILLFFPTTVVFLTFMFFGILGIKSIALQKKYIERLSELYEETI